MSPDGRFITFASGAQDLTAQADGNALGSDIYVRDVVNNVTRLVSINMAGTASGNGTSFGGSISADGRYVVFTFFFQAEDGIRDADVTGVQTCALPIYRRRRPQRAWGRGGVARRHRAARHGSGGLLSGQPRCADRPEQPRSLRRQVAAAAGRRSEERRVGKECRWRWSPGD